MSTATIAPAPPAPPVRPAGAFRALLRLARGHNREFAVVAVLTLAATATTLSIPAFITAIVERAQYGYGLQVSDLMIVGLMLVNAVITAAQSYLLQRIGEGVVRNARRGLIGRLLRLPIPFFDRRPTGDLLSRVSGDTAQLRGALVDFVMSFAGGGLMVVGAGTLMAVTDPMLFGVTAAVAVGAVLIVTSLSGLLRGAALEAQQRLGDLSASVERDLSAIRTIRATNATGDEEAKVLGRVDATWAAGLKLARLQSLVEPLSSMTMNVCVLCVLGVGGYRVATGAMSVPGLVSFTMFLFIMVTPLVTVLSSFSELSVSLGAFARVQEILHEPSEADLDEPAGPAEPNESNGAHDPNDATGLADAGTADAVAPHASAVAFHNVAFRYTDPDADPEDDDRPDNLVLRDVSLTAAVGRRTAIVGPSGAGKSTILQLVERFYEPDGGSVSVLGKDLRDYDREDLRRHLAYVEQDAPVISGTLRDNLTLGNPGATDERCHEVLGLVNLSELAARSPLGLDAPVGEGGAELSGGERQRLAFARALLSPAPILLLDESTSNLDGLNERAMKRVLDSLTPRKTAIVVAHRLSTVVDSDVIYVLEHGRVAGRGTHNQLLESVPIYRELAKEQLLDRPRH